MDLLLLELDLNALILRYHVNGNIALILLLSIESIGNCEKYITFVLYV